MKQSLRVLLDSLIDYAGLFPPASLSLEQAVTAYARYRAGSESWMLGRFVVPEARAAEIPADFPLSVLASPDALPSGACLEVRARNADEIGAIAAAFERMPAGGRPVVYVEIADIGLVAEVGRAGLRAKIRTGGVTPDAIPSHDRVARFIRTCAMEGVPFKATAGLHHPVRCVRPLTYEADAPTGTMHGFVNVFMASALVNDAERILLEEDPRAFRFEDEVAVWRDRAVSTGHLRDVRNAFAISFGSCSFEEPIEDLRACGWM